LSQFDPNETLKPPKRLAEACPHGGGGTSNDFGLAAAYATARLLRLADGPDEVHRNQIARLELRKYSN
jgi:alkylation response protein AidB-like acyl-CoA dehydrogenase